MARHRRGLQGELRSYDKNTRDRSRCASRYRARGDASFKKIPAKVHNIKVGEENNGDINLYYKDWGSGQPVVFSHGWPLSADDWDAQMLFFGQHGYRVIAHDRRGHGRSSQTWEGNEMDTYADDLAALVEQLDLKNAIHVGHSTGGGEVARYLGRHGTF